MNRIKETKALRAETSVHYNCCQAVVIPFRDLCGVDRETARRTGSCFGGGMRHGGTCGAVSGALMVLGLVEADEDKVKEFLSRFRQKHGVLDCAHLLASAKEAGIPRSCHCDSLVFEAVALLETILGE